MLKNVGAWEIFIVCLAGLFMGYCSTRDKTQYQTEILMLKIAGTACVVLGVAILIGESTWAIKSFVKILIISGAIIAGVSYLLTSVGFPLEVRMHKRMNELNEKVKDEFNEELKDRYGELLQKIEAEILELEVRTSPEYKHLSPSAATTSKRRIQ